MDNSEHEKDLKKHFKGTTTIGLSCSDGIILCADARASLGALISNMEAKKITKIDVNLGMTMAGSIGDAQEIIRILKIQNEIYKMDEGRPLSPKSAASLLSIILQSNKMVMFQVGLLLGGMDGDEPQLYSIDAIGGYLPENKFAATGSGSDVAIGYLEDNFKKGISTKEGIKLAIKAIQIAMKRDVFTGDNISLAVITKAGYAEYFGKEVEKLTAPAAASK